MDDDEKDVSGLLTEDEADEWVQNAPTIIPASE